MRQSHWQHVRLIYAEGIATGNATFETQAPDWQSWNRTHLPSCRLVAREADSIIGWGALSPVSSRLVYSGVAEVSLYVAAHARGRGVGQALLNELVACSEQAGIWTLQAGILTENEASLAVHESAGFRVVGKREKIGQLNGAWRDVVLMERRSRVVGIE
jgi:phosphinothricin acetyltransferase